MTASGGKSYYVSPDGSDEQPGTAEMPLKTLAKALALSRQEQGECSIIAGKGVYEDVALTLDKRDSGLAIKSCGEALLCGGKKVRGWSPYGDGCYCITLPPETNADFSMIMVNGRYCERARFPAEGRLKHKSKYEEQDTTRNGIYLDEHTARCVIEGNLVSGCQSALMNHLSKGNTIRNNVFVSQDGPVMVSFIRCQEYVIEKNAFHAKDEVTFAHRKDAFAVFDGNLLYSAIGKIESVYVADDYSRSPPGNFIPFSEKDNKEKST